MDTAAPPRPPAAPATPRPGGRRRLLQLVGPLLVVAVAVGFAGRLATTGSGPDQDRLEAAALDPCTLLTLQEMGVLVDATFKDFVADRQSGFAVCFYLGMPFTDIDVIEVSVATDAMLRGEGHGRAQDALAAAAAGAGDVTAVPGLGDESAVLPLGVGEVWTRTGDALLRVSVTRDGTVGDTDAAAVITRALLTKLGAS